MDEKAVLIVEDEPILRMHAADIFHDEGFTVIEAATGDEGLVILKEHPEVKVLFADIDTPGTLNGLGLARYAAAYFSHVHQLIVSGKMLPHPDMLPAGARFLSKPYEVNEVIAHILEALRSE